VSGSEAEKRGYPNPEQFTRATCPYCTDARKAGMVGCLRHTSAALIVDPEEAETQ
jgi:hypothetical protein